MLTFEVRQDRGAHTVILSQDFALSLALLRRGTLEQKLVWTFHLYDLNGDGLLSREEIRDVTTSVSSHGLKEGVKNIQGPQEIQNIKTLKSQIFIFGGKY